MSVATENQSSGGLPSQSNNRKGLAILAAAVIIGGGVGLLVLGGLPSRVDAPAGSSVADFGPIALPQAADSLRVAPEVGALAPDFVLETPEGEVVRLSDLRGQPVLINFWATWCGPCRVEMPAIQATFDAHQSDGFVVLAVDNTATDSVPAVIAFGEEFGLSFPLLIDPGSKVNTRYTVRAYPSSFFIDKDGVIQTVHFGPMTEGQLSDFVSDLLP